MACGLPVVDIDSEHTRISYQPNTAVLAEATPVGLASALSRLLNDALFRQITSQAGLSATELLTWDRSNKLIETFIQESLPSAPATPQPDQPTTPLVTVVIPVYNGGSMLKAVVESCLEQDLDHAFEVLVIDSASSDGCLNALPQDERLRLHRIRKEDFGHGRTRNLGVELARGVRRFHHSGCHSSESHVADESDRPTARRSTGGRGLRVPYRPHQSWTTNRPRP